ncbi:NrdG Organic radical activating enzymes [uncultured Caudovirales phage]|uniref:NrdG Organic radical activating enzymes n=1 Tax=uncultured Caudovirales phage TaxID=2100421 RepID=A0A6J5T2A8_9CAUD|nr:NrdG Organic radical activating enzymes [uncultured Caudovirales phage]
MSKIKIAELFYSIQGEGRYMGVPSVFLRTFGCNFKCAGFGMPRGELSEEANNVDPSKYTDYKMLPLVSTGCDSYASWDPRFKDLSPMLTTDAIVERIIEILPHGEWRDEHLVITGGEPLLGWQKQYPDLLKHPKMKGLKEITFETNGTMNLTTEFKQYLHTWKYHDDDVDFYRDVTFSVSAKLPCSGEPWEDAIKPERVCEYEEYGTAYLKFVIATEEDFADAERAIAEYRAAGFTGHVYLMPVGGVESVYALNNRNVALLAMKHGLRYSDRLQVPLFKNEWGT